MNSNVNNKIETPSALSAKEMIGFVFIVSSSLYLLYPEGKIEKILNKNREENTQLSIDYLKSMLIHNPNNIELKQKLIEKYRSNGNFIKALKLIQEIIQNTDDSIALKKLYKKEYLISKDIYFTTNNSNKKSQILGLNKKLNNFFLYTNNIDDYIFLLDESTSMDFKELRYKSFSYLLQQKPVSLKVKEEAVDFFISYDKTKEAELLIIDLLEKEDNQQKRLEYFTKAFYIFTQNKVKNREKLEKIIQLYKEKSPLTKDNLYLVSNAYLQINQKNKAAEFIYSSFKTHKEFFDEKSSYEAIRILSYNAQLNRALEVSDYTYKKYPSKKSLDSKIMFSTWLSKSDEVVALNIKGWQEYKDEKYKKYLLENTTFHNAYEVRGKIYKLAIKNGDFSMIKDLGEYYEYTGEITKAENYFNALVKKYPKKSIYKEAIRFSHDNSNFKNVDRLYADYKKKFGIDREIHKKLIDEYIITKQVDRAYIFTKELKELGKAPVKPHEHKVAQYGHQHKEHQATKTNYTTILKQLAWIDQDYNYLYNLLWKEEKSFTKTKNSYATLISLESKLSKTPRLQYLYKRAWETTSDRTYIPLLLSSYIDKKEYKKFHKEYHLLNTNDITALEKFSYFHILLASYYQGIEKHHFALASFQKALDLDPKSSEIHQSYLWFLLNRNYHRELDNELSLLKKDKKLQKSIAFPSVVAALKLDKSDLAYTWLKPLLREDKNNLEYQALYADILDFQGKKNQAKAIRFKLFRDMHRKIESSEALLKDKEFAQLYLQMALSYKFPYSKKVYYMKKFKSLFTEKEYLDIELSFYSSQHMLNKIDQLVSKHKLNYPWLNLYLATQRGDKEFAKKAYSKNNHDFSLKDRISIAIDSKHKDDAYSQLFKGMQENQNSISLATTYWRLINDEFPKSKFAIKSEHLSRNVSLENMEFSTKYALNDNLHIEINFLQKDYIRKDKNNFKERALGFSLSNYNSDFLWSLNLKRYFGDIHYNSAQFMLHYNLENTSVELNIKRNNTIALTPKLQMYGLENSIALDLTYDINERNIFGISYTKSDYSLKDGEYLGNGDIVQLSTTHMFRLGYPDLTLFNHLNIENFDFENKNIGLSSFTEIGSEITIGANTKNLLQKSWKPYLSLGMAVNDHKQIGSSLTIGATGMAYQADKLDLSLRYIRGVNNLDEELYGAYLNYSF